MKLDTPFDGWGVGLIGSMIVMLPIGLVAWGMNANIAACVFFANGLVLLGGGIYIMLATLFHIFKGAEA